MKPRCRATEVLGCLLLALSAVLLILALLSGNSPAQVAGYSASGRAVVVQEIQPQQGSVPVNAADAQALDVLPGVGPAIAQAIIDERQNNGPFFYPEDLMQVSGIGEKKLEDMRDMLDLTEE